MEGIFDLVGWPSRRAGKCLVLAGVGWDTKLKSRQHLRFRCARGVGRASMRVKGQVLLKLPLAVPVPEAKGFQSGGAWRLVDPHESLSSDAVIAALKRADIKRIDVRESAVELALPDDPDWRVLCARLRNAMKLADALAYQRFGRAALALGMRLGGHEAFGVVAGHPTRVRFGRTGVDLFVHCRGRSFVRADQPALAGAIDDLDARVAPDGLHAQIAPMTAEALVARVLAMVDAARAVDGRAGARRAS